MEYVEFFQSPMLHSSSFCMARSDAGLCRLSGPTAVSLPEEMVGMETCVQLCHCVLFVQVRWVYNLPNPETPFFPIAQFLPAPGLL